MWSWSELCEQLEIMLKAAHFCPSPVVNPSGSFNDGLRNKGGEQDFQYGFFL